jgi:hypothetical protein
LTNRAGQRPVQDQSAYNASIAPNEDDLSVAHFNSTSGAYGRVTVLGRGFDPRQPRQPSHLPLIPLGN